MSIGYRTLSQHLNDLKKENFSLKLRIYFLEDRIQNKYEDSSNDVYKSNIELKVEVESLKQKLLEKQQLIEKVWADYGHQSGCSEPELHQEYKQKQEEANHTREVLEKKITFLKEEIMLAKNEVDQISAVAETEKENCLKLEKTIEEFTADMTEARLLQKNYCNILAEKDRMIQQMTLLLDNKDSLISQLTEKNQNLINYQIKDLEKSVHGLNETLQQRENEIKNLFEKKSQDAAQYETLLAQQASSLQKAGMEVQALQEKLQESKDIIKSLQESHQQLTSKISSAQELTHNQECLLQSLRDTLQSRDHEVMELYQIIDEHNTTIAKLQDMLLKCQNEQLQSFQVMPTQLQFLDLQNTLFSTQMELQKKQMALRQKDRQLTDVKRSQRLLEVDLLEGQQQKETTWKHNQELHGVLHKLQRELQEKSQHLKNLEEEKCTKLLAQEHNIERLRQTVTQKEQILQEYMDVLHYQQNLEKVPGGNEHMIEKLRQRIKDRDAALEKAVDDKFCAVEEKEKEIQRLKMIIREREHDLERLSNVLSGNEETINSLDNLVKAKDMELEQISAAFKNLQWLKQETEEKYRCSLNERESIIVQLQKNLQERNKDIESDICSGDVIEELKVCLHRKEKMLQDAVFARNQQAEEHTREVMDLLAMISSEKLDQSTFCQNCLLKEQNIGVNQPVENLSNFIHLQKLVQEKEKIIQAFSQSLLVQPITLSTKSEELDAKGAETENNETLETDLAKAKEDMRLILRKMKEYQLEVSALQSIIMKQNEQLREQGADIDTLTRTIQIKDELIKDLQVKLVDPEDIPTVELLTQQIFTLKENIASLNLASRGHLRHTQKIFNLLEELAANKSRLNEALQAEKQLYSCLVQSHTEADSSTLHSELAAAQALRGQLEDALMRTMEQLVTLQSENKQGGICDNNSSEKKKVQHTEPQEDENDGIMKAELQKLKNELQHSSIKTNRMEEELHIRKPEINDDLRFSTPDWRPVKHYLNKTRKFDLNMEKASGTLEQGVDKNEMGYGLDMSKEIRKQKAEFNMDKNQRFVGQLERKITAIINDTNERIQKGMEIYPAKAGQSREGSLKRGLNGSNPIVEGAIPKMTPAWKLYSTHNDSCPAASCLPVCSSMQECPQEPLLETQNTKLHEPLISSNENQSGSNLDRHFLKHETRDTHMDFLDLGYETCGKSENELDREETTSPECEEDEDMLNHMVTEDSNCQSRFCMDTTSSKNKCSWHSDQKSDVEVLQKHMSKLKDQLETSQELMKHLQNQSCPSLKSHSFTEDDEGWQSDTNVHHSYTFLEQLAKRVSKLESYFYNFQKDAGTQHHIKQIAGPGEYNWLIQAQARELSLLRQKVKEGESISCTLTQNTEEAIKSFEEMLRANDIDYFMGQNFREHLNQGSQLAKKLNSKLQSKGLSKVNKSTEDELHTNRNKIKILQKDLMETFQSTPENRSFSPSSHESVQSDSSIILDDQLSDELDVCSGLSVTSDCSSYEDSTQDSDMCYNSVLVNDTQMEIDSRNGVYIFCHSEDFSALKKNVLDGKSLLNNIQSNLQSVLHIPHPQVHGNKVKNNRKIDALFSAIKTLNNILEDSNSILGMFWSWTSPTKEVNRQTKQERVMKEEICTLKNKLHEQAVLLQKASDHVKHTNCAREGMEKLILKQLTTTCGALKKAKLNLLVKCNKKVFRPSFQQT